MQPLVLKLAKTIGFTDYSEGLNPDILMSEIPQNYGVLGNENEPLLARALSEISMSNNPIYPNEIVIPFTTSNNFEPFLNEMIIDRKIPQEFINRLSFKK